MIKNYNHDIMEWVQFPKYDIIYTDPPWEQKMVNYFQTVMKRDSGRTAYHSIEELIGQLALLADKQKPVYIEYSVEGWELVLKIMVDAGHTCRGVFNAMQSNNMPYKILFFNTNVPPVTINKGFKVIADTLSHYYRGLTVFDPFAGIGKIAKTVRIIGDIYIGSEINPARFKKLCEANP